jgi:hypothetical protein
MFKRKNMEISGDVIADEVFLNVIGKNEYLVSIMNQNVPNMPIAIAVMKTRHFNAMKTFYDFVSENHDLKFLTSNMLSVYGLISKYKNIKHQECVFHSMDYIGKYIFNELKKKEKYDYHDKIWFNTLLTEYREILREFNYDEAVNKKKNFITKINDYLKKGKLPKVFKKIVNHLNRRFEKLTTHTREENIDRTSNKCETFNSLAN